MMAQSLRRTRLDLERTAATSWSGPRTYSLFATSSWLKFKARHHLRCSPWFLAVLLLGIACDRPLQADTLSNNGGPLNFRQSAPDGFGDPQNSWPWSMLWWKGKLFVGTNRAFACVKEWEEQVGIGGAAGKQLFPYPPDPASGIVCTDNPADLPLRAEIWTIAAGASAWTMAYQSPNDLQNPDYPGKSLARDIGYRTMTPFTEGDGTEALYIGGVNSQPMWAGRRSFTASSSEYRWRHLFGRPSGSRHLSGHPPLRQPRCPHFAERKPLYRQRKDGR